MICYARSGGTLLNRCLASLPDTVVLSEVHPRQNEVIQQANQWYGMQLQATGSFVDDIREVASVCATQNRTLIVRDWPYIDFCPLPEQEPHPSGTLTTLNLFETAHIPVRPFAFIRDAIDIWISNHCPPLPVFTMQYERYLDALHHAHIPIFKYEDFTRNPETEMQRLCRTVGLPYSDDFLNYSQWHSVKGDMQRMTGSRGLWDAGIRTLPRKRIAPSQQAQLAKDPGMAVLNERMGYPPDYTGRPLEERTLQACLKESFNRFQYMVRNKNLGTFLKKYVFRKR
jgi:hypothetical protein